MGLIDVYRINPADSFSVKSASLKKQQDITYFTLLSKIRGDLNLTSIDNNIEKWNEAYDNTIISGNVTGYETKTINLVRRDGSVVSFDFTDLNPQSEDTLDMVTTRGNVTVNTIDVGGVKTDYVQFDTAATTTLEVGRMAWNTTDGTVDLRMMGNNVTLQIGQESVARVVNKTGADLLEANYQAVKITGAQGNRLKVGLARADSDPNSADTLGLVTETIANNQEGFVTTSGLVRNINTTGSLQSETWADGDVIYLSPITFGAVTNIKPIAPQHTVILGFVVRSHPTQGQIYVKVDNGYEIDELHNVRIATPPTNGQFLVYNSTLSVWENQTISAGGVSGGGTATEVAFWNTSTSISSDSNLYWDNTNKWLGIGTSMPTMALDVVGNISIGDSLTGYAEIMTPGGPLFIYDGPVGYLRVGNFARQDFITGITTLRDGNINATLYLYNQNLGIGTTNPIEKLVVSNAGAEGFEFQPSTGRFYRYDRVGMAYGGIYEEASEYTWSIGPSEKMRLDSSGNLGLNTSSPTQLLDVRGDMSFGTGTYGMIYGPDGKRYIAYTDNFLVPGARNLVIDPTGGGLGPYQIGYGYDPTFSGLTARHIFGNGDVYSYGLIEGGFAVKSPTYYFSTPIPSTGAIFISGGVGNDEISYNASFLLSENLATSSLFLDVGISGSHSSSQVRLLGYSAIASNGSGMSVGNGTIAIDSTGNVGIGTSSPFTKLHVVGTIMVESTLSFNSIASIYQNSNSNLVINNPGWGFLGKGIDISASGAVTITPGASFGTYFTSGKVGILTTSPLYDLDVNGTANFQQIFLKDVDIESLMIAYSIALG